MDAISDFVDTYESSYDSDNFFEIGTGKGDTGTRTFLEILADEFFMRQGWRKRFIVCVLNDIVLYFLAPRLDVPVSVDITHLLKSPLSAHPVTGNVCQIIEDFDTFDPDEAPCVADIDDEGTTQLSLYL
jgi:DNA primase catalytic subunit